MTNVVANIKKLFSKQYRYCFICSSVLSRTVHLVSNAQSWVQLILQVLNIFTFSLSRFFVINFMNWKLFIILGILNFFAGSQIDDGYKNAFHTYIKYFKKNERDGKRILWEETANTHSFTFTVILLCHTSGSGGSGRKIYYNVLMVYNIAIVCNYARMVLPTLVAWPEALWYKL